MYKFYVLFVPQWQTSKTVHTVGCNNYELISCMWFLWPIFIVILAFAFFKHKNHNLLAQNVYT